VRRASGHVTVLSLVVWTLAGCDGAGGTETVTVGGATVTVSETETKTVAAPDVSRDRRVFAGGWTSRCDFDSCGTAVTSISYVAPNVAKHVDVTLTITFDYKTSRGDGARMALSLDDGTPPYEVARPRSALQPSDIPGHRILVTKTWVKKNLPAERRAYTFKFSVASVNGNPGLSEGTHDEGADNQHSVAYGRKITAVIKSEW
jgi:hypothetical protein